MIEQQQQGMESVPLHVTVGVAATALIFGTLMGVIVATIVYALTSAA